MRSPVQYQIAFATSAPSDTPADAANDDVVQPSGNVPMQELGTLFLVQLPDQPAANTEPMRR